MVQMCTAITLTNTTEVNSNFANHFSGRRNSDNNNLCKEYGSPFHMSKYTTLIQLQKANKGKIYLMTAKLIQNGKQKMSYSFFACFLFQTKNVSSWRQLSNSSNTSYCWTDCITCYKTKQKQQDEEIIQQSISNKNQIPIQRAFKNLSQNWINKNKVWWCLTFFLIVTVVIITLDI